VGEDLIERRPGSLGQPIRHGGPLDGSGVSLDSRLECCGTLTSVLAKPVEVHVRRRAPEPPDPPSARH
jgi:hypothetical protein